ncbi:hypothetical protein PFISCL1PPCAC_27022, partial [Pristionchus fissidentatus]
ALGVLLGSSLGIGGVLIYDRIVYPTPVTTAAPPPTPASFPPPSPCVEHNDTGIFRMELLNYTHPSFIDGECKSHCTKMRTRYFDNHNRDLKQSEMETYQCGCDIEIRVFYDLG